jgi:ABC-type phosphate transport system substrate-binding protein
MKHTPRLTLTLFALTAILAAGSQAATFKVVVNNGVHVQTMPKKAVSDLFMKRTTKWEGGANVVPVDQTDQAAVRDDFSRTIHGKPTAAVKSYWNQQIFSGREVPPVEKPSDADVVAFVRSTAGAVGYVSETAATDGVRVIQVQ